MAELARLLKRRLSDLRSDPAVMSCLERLGSSQREAALTPKEMLLVERCSAAGRAVGDLDREFKTAQFLHAGGQVTLAEQALQEYYKTRTQVESIESMMAKAEQSDPQPQRSRDRRRQNRGRRQRPGSDEATSPPPSNPHPNPRSSPGWMRGRDGLPVVQRDLHSVRREERISHISASIKDDEYRAARQLEAEENLRHVFDSLVRARKRLKRLRRHVVNTDTLSPRERLAAVTVSVEAAETQFAMAEWRCKKAPLIGHDSFLDAVSAAVNFARRAHAHLDILQVDLRALQAGEIDDRGNDLRLAEKVELDRMFEAMQGTRTTKEEGGEMQSYYASVYSPLSPRTRRDDKEAAEGPEDEDDKRRVTLRRSPQSSTMNSSSTLAGSSSSPRSDRISPSSFSAAPITIAVAHSNPNAHRGLIPALAAREAKLMLSERKQQQQQKRRQRGSTMVGLLQDAEDGYGEESPPVQTLELSGGVTGIRVGPADADRGLAAKKAIERQNQQEQEKIRLQTLEKQQQQQKQRDKRLEDDAMLAYRDIQTRIQKEIDRKAVAHRQRKAQRAAAELRQEEVRAAQARKFRTKTARRRWVRVKDAVLDRVRQKNNRMGHFRMALQLKLERERMMAEDEFAKFVRQSEQVVTKATKEALEAVWQRIGPNLERHGHPLINQSFAGTSTSNSMGSVAAAGKATKRTRQTTKLMVAVLHATPGPLVAGATSPLGAVNFGNAHPLSQFFASAHAKLKSASKGTDRRELVFHDYRAFDGEFPTTAEQRRAHAFVVLGDVASGDDPVLHASISRNPLAAFLRHIVASEKCVLAMGAGHTLLARACGGGPSGNKLKRKRLPKWVSGPMFVTPTTMGRSDALWQPATKSKSLRILHAHDSVFQSAPPGFMVIARGSVYPPAPTNTPTFVRDSSDGTSWVAAMRYGLNVLSFSGFPFLGPASFRESILRLREQQTMRKDLAAIKKRAYLLAGHSKQTSSVTSTVPSVPSVSSLCRLTQSSTVADAAFAHLLRGATSLSSIHGFTSASLVAADGFQIVASGCASTRVPLCSVSACNKAVEEQGADVVCIGVVVSKDGVCMAAPSPWLPNVVSDDELDVAQGATVDDLQAGPWSINGDSWIERAASPPSPFERCRGLSKYQENETCVYDATCFVQSHPAAALSKMKRNCPGKWVRLASSDGGSLVYDRDSPRGISPPTLATLADTLREIGGGDGGGGRGRKAVWLVPIHSGKKAAGTALGTASGACPQLVPKMLLQSVRQSGFIGAVTLATYDETLMRECRRGFGWDWSYVRIMSGEQGNILANMESQQAKAFMARLSRSCGGVCIHKDAVLAQLSAPLVVTGSEGSAGATKKWPPKTRSGLKPKATAKKLSFAERVRLEDMEDAKWRKKKEEEEKRRKKKKEVERNRFEKISDFKAKQARANDSSFFEFDATRPSVIVQAAHEMGVRVYARGFSAAPGMIPVAFAGRPHQEYMPYILSQVDGVVTSFPQHASTAREQLMQFFDARRKQILEQNKTEELQQQQQQQQRQQASAQTPPSYRPKSTKDKNTNSFRPARPILRRAFITASSPRAKRGLRTRWVPRQNPDLYNSGVDRIARISGREERKKRISRARKMKNVMNGGSSQPRKVSAGVFQFYSTLASSIPTKRPDPLKGFTSV